MILPSPHCVIPAAGLFLRAGNEIAIMTWCDGYFVEVDEEPTRGRVFAAMTLMARMGWVLHEDMTNYWAIRRLDKEWRVINPVLSSEYLYRDDIAKLKSNLQWLI